MRDIWEKADEAMSAARVVGSLTEDLYGSYYNQALDAWLKDGLDMNAGESGEFYAAFKDAMEAASRPAFNFTECATGFNQVDRFLADVAGSYSDAIAKCSSGLQDVAEWAASNGHVHVGKLANEKMGVAQAISERL